MEGAPPARDHVRLPDRVGLLDRRRDPRRHLRDLHPRPPAQRRLHRDRQLRPGGVHGDRRVRLDHLHGRLRAPVPALPADRDRRHDARRACSSGCPRCACAPTTSRSRRSPSRRSSATSPRTPARSPAATRARSRSSSTRTRGSSSPTRGSTHPTGSRPTSSTRSVSAARTSTRYPCSSSSGSRSPCSPSRSRG